jgi:hypothetical protein
VESYTTLQQSITSTIREHPEHIEITAAVVVPNPITSVEFITHPRHPRPGQYPYYAVRAGRTTGIFTNWPDCFRATNGVRNDFRGFDSLNAAQRYLDL